MRVSFDDAMAGTTVPVKITGPAAVPDVSRVGRRARHEPDDLSRVRRQR